MSNLIDVLSDVVTHAMPMKPTGIGIIGTATETIFAAMNNPHSCHIAMKAEARIPIPEFAGNFGLPGFALKSMKASLAQAAEAVVSGTTHATANIKLAMPGGATVYPLMMENLPKHLSEKPGKIKWGPRIRLPSKSVIDSFSKWSAHLPKADQMFTFRTDRGQLKFIFDRGKITSKGTFAKNVKTQIKPPTYWECDDFLKVLRLAVNAKKSSIRISTQGVIKVYIDTQFIKYSFLLPGWVR